MINEKLFRKRKMGFFVIWGLLLVTISIMADFGGVELIRELVGHVPHYDVIIHFFLVGSLGFFAILATSQDDKRSWLGFPKLVWLLLLLTVLEECSQLLREQRSFSFADMGANVLGILVFSWLATKLRLRRLFANTEAVGSN